MWYMEQKNDPQLLELKNLLSTGYWKNQKKEKILQKYPLVEPFLHNIKQFWLRKDDLFYRKVSTNFQGAQTCLWQLLLPQQLVEKALEGCHDQCGHLGFIGQISTRTALNILSPVDLVSLEKPELLTNH